MDFDNGSENYLKRKITRKTSAQLRHGLSKSTSLYFHFSRNQRQIRDTSHCPSFLALFLNIVPLFSHSSSTLSLPSRTLSPTVPPSSHSFSHCPSLLALFLALSLLPRTLPNTIALFQIQMYEKLQSLEGFLAHYRSHQTLPSTDRVGLYSIEMIEL